ncbi:YpfN family protein [Jinshanibacter sp. LJY008]|uniref:YpfN family protein n=1 Tax=Limnobaculum eriocheiris TaxID=2897391 RepID=A0A9X1SK04_9GAMM|nr:YpfN family protein [Limnobaculum eriocheiris]MCD1124744.1 YpfN family protein [Limnobaculum eriocheiris]
MHWLADYWWVILIVLVGMIINGIKALYKVNYDRSMKENSKLPPHRDNNAAWDKEEDEEWNRNNKK